MIEADSQPGQGTIGTASPFTRVWGAWCKRVGLNSVWLLAGRIIAQLQLAAFTVLVARVLGAGGFGQYALITTIIFILNVVTTFGTDTLLIREMPREPGKENLAGAALLLQLALSVILIACLLAAPGEWFSASPQVQTELRTYSLALLPLSFFSVFTAALRAWERMDLYLGASVIAAGIQIAIGWVVLQSYPQTGALVNALLVVQVCAALAAGGLCWKFIPGFSFDRGSSFAQVFPILRKAWPLALLAALGVLNQRFGVLSLSAISGSTPTGWFSAASRVVETLKFGHIAVLGAALPAVSRLRELSQPADEGKRVLRTAFVALLALASLEIATTLLLSPWLVGTLFGEQFSPSAALLRMMVWQLLPYTITSVLSLRLVAYRRERALLTATAAGALANLGLYLWLVGQSDASGASLAVVLGECVMAVILIALR